MASRSESTGDDTTELADVGAEAQSPESGGVPVPVVDLTEPKAPSRRFYANLSDL